MCECECVLDGTGLERVLHNCVCVCVCACGMVAVWYIPVTTQS